MEHKLNIGDILVCSWGYSMFLYDFFQVVGKTEKSIKIQELKKDSKPADGWLRCQVWPIKDCFVGAPVTRRIDKDGYFHGKLSSQNMHVSHIYDPEIPCIEDHAD